MRIQQRYTNEVLYIREAREAVIPDMPDSCADSPPCCLRHDVVQSNEASSLPSFDQQIIFLVEFSHRYNDIF